MRSPRFHRRSSGSTGGNAYNSKGLATIGGIFLALILGVAVLVLILVRRSNKQARAVLALPTDLKENRADRCRDKRMDERRADPP